MYIFIQLLIYIFYVCLYLHVLYTHLHIYYINDSFSYLTMYIYINYLINIKLLSKKLICENHFQKIIKLVLFVLGYSKIYCSLICLLYIYVIKYFVNVNNIIILLTLMNLNYINLNISQSVSCDLYLYCLCR